jgi:hypothetical protein
MGSLLETVALFCFKLVYETDDGSPVLRDDLIMSDYQQDVFELLVTRGDTEAVRKKIDECLRMAQDALGGTDKPLGRELHTLTVAFDHATTLQAMEPPLIAIKQYLKDIQ